MKRKILFAFIICTILLSETQTANAFFDVAQTNKYYPAITFLQKYNIISGYEDGTFKPFGEISRAEFLKIIIKSAGLQTDISASSGFKDVDEESWYAPYVKKAQAEGILNGYPDKTFRPANPVTKAEALKIIGLTQKWNTATPLQTPFTDIPVTTWFAPYVDFARTNKLIEQSRYFQPDTAITRGLVSDIIYKSDATGIFKISQTQSQAPNTTTIAPAVPSPENGSYDNFKPIASPAGPSVKNEGNAGFEMINKGFFDNIVLNSDFPSQFYKNEIYKFEGLITSGSFNSIFVFLAYKDQNGNSKNLDFISDVKSGKFEIPVVFRYAGSYDIGIIPGTKGASKVKSISVIDGAIPTGSSISQNKPSNLKINFSQDKTTVSFSRPASSIIKLAFTQGNKNVSYISRQQTEAIDVAYQDFYDFIQGSATLKVESASTSSLFPLNLSSAWDGNNISFVATRHLFSKIETSKISVSGLQSIMPSPVKISISGIANTDILQKATIIKANGLTEVISLNSGIKPVIINGTEALPKGSSYSLSYTPISKGVYIIGISETNGAAIINVPIYVENVIPLLPDFFDIKDLIPEDTSLAGANNKYLNYVNNARQKFGLRTIKLDNDLIILAQSHSEDMAKNNYFGHNDLQNASPNDRRITMGIQTEVGENIAKTSSLTAGFEGLMRSPGHRKNILHSAWTKVGFGFAKNTNGEILVTQEFSSDPLTESDISKLKNDLLTYINDSRKNNGLPQLTENAQANVIAKSWSEKMASDNFTDLKAQDGSSLTDMVQSQLQYSFAEMFVYSQNTTEFFKENVLHQINVSENNVSYVGMGIAVSKLGDIKATIILLK